jgi:alpha-glucosidase (family GH31 glycosyl hydrolase)
MISRSCSAVDFGESAPLDGVWHDGTAPHLMHNRYPLPYQRAVAEVSEATTGSPMILGAGRVGRLPAVPRPRRR